MILVIGAKGSMGQRYQSILRYLGKEMALVDAEHNRHYIKQVATACKGIIIASPTDTHAEYIRHLMDLRIPILCEKPVVKSVDELKALLAELKAARTPFRMMYQYQILAQTDRLGRTHYNYFRHGNDGLAWDCIQILGLARGECHLAEDSPVWRCMINGKALSSAHMDAAYIAYVQKWLQYPNQNPDEILQAHERASQAAENGVTRAH
jgi:hypothetical protein